jgi:hypothetical protein
MSASSAVSNAMSARSASDTNQKLNYLAQAIVELARTIGEIEEDVRRIKNSTNS